MRAGGAVGAGTDRLLLVVAVVVVVVKAKLQPILFGRSSPESIEHHASAVLNDTSFSEKFSA